MKKIDLTPEALHDLELLKDYLDREFGTRKEQQILRAIFADLKRLSDYPETDIHLFERFGIMTDYKCIYTHQNYAFYRLEGDCIKVIRILDHRRDFLHVLFGISMRSDESIDYWGDE